MSDLIPLSRWWQRSEQSPIAISSQDYLKTPDFFQRVSQWVQALESCSGQRWGVYHSDAAEFLAMVCALWQLDKTACIPGDNLAGTVASLENSVAGFIGEFDIETVEAKESAVNRISEWKTIPAEHIAIEVYTSGSTGQPKSIQKTMQELETELLALNILKADEVDVVLATVSHQHLYGLTFRLLRPFCLQQAFCNKLLEYPEDLMELASQVGRFSFISSPAHLSRMTGMQNWSSIQDKCIDIYSSAAPLARADSMQVSHYLHAKVKEIYGSSETGAIAWRCQQDSETDALWQALPHVQLQPSHENTLQVSMKNGNSQIPLSDNVSFTEDGRFALLGRTDQLVKVEGKRLSLQEMEAKLQARPWLEQVKVVTLNRKRTETAVVATLTPAGQSLLKDEGRKQLIAQLKQYLKTQYEAVLIPRRWRFVDQLPYNSQGKLPIQTLRSLFDAQQVSWPELLGEERTESSVLLHCSLPENLKYFDGHFEQQAILPGVVQVHWAQHFARSLIGESLTFVRLEVIKFQQLLLPGQAFSLQLNFDANKKKVTFEFNSEQGIHSSGRICYD